MRQKHEQISETMEKSLQTIKKSIQTSLKTMGNLVKNKMLQILSKFAFLAPHICDFSSEMLQKTCK